MEFLRENRWMVVEEGLRPRGFVWLKLSIPKVGWGSIYRKWLGLKVS